MQRKRTSDAAVYDNDPLPSHSPLAQYNNNSSSIYGGGDAAPGFMNSQISRSVARDRYKIERNTREVYTNCENASLDGFVMMLVKSPIIQAGLVAMGVAYFVSNLVLVGLAALVAFVSLQKPRGRG
jgi:hypothetical protein